jgi:hypothetical protein
VLIHWLSDVKAWLLPKIAHYIASLFAEIASARHGQNIETLLLAFHHRIQISQPLWRHISFVGGGAIGGPESKSQFRWMSRIKLKSNVVPSLTNH